MGWKEGPNVIEPELTDQEQLRRGGVTKRIRVSLTKLWVQEKSEFERSCCLQKSIHRNVSNSFKKCWTKMLVSSHRG